jgi:alkylation response protein AidB-like acyl-CoA dehydrogenase
MSAQTAETSAREDVRQISGTAGPPPVVRDARTARAFAEGWVAPGAAQRDRDERIDGDTLRAMTEAGLWAGTIPAEHGGFGLDSLTVGEVHAEIGRFCSSVRALLTVHQMVGWAIDRWGSAEQRSCWLPHLATGEVRGAFCLTEPGGGAAMARVASTARRETDGWVLDGHKMWITGGLTADLLLVFARTENGVLPFLVPTGSEGISRTPITGMLGGRAGMLAGIDLSAVKVGQDSVLGPQGFAEGAVMTHALDLGRYTVAWGCVGMIQACLDACAEHANRRLPSGRTLGRNQLIGAKIADMVGALRASRLLCEDAGRLKDRGDQETILATWVAKYFASRAAVGVSTDAVQIMGAQGCGPDSLTARFYRDAKVMEIIEGSNEIQQLTISAHLLRGRVR